MMQDPSSLEALIRRVFRELPPIADVDLAEGYSRNKEWWNHYLEDDLRHYRNRGRYEPLEFLTCQDEDMIYRVSGYARWFFAPTFMIMAIRGFEKYEFDYLLNIFKYSTFLLSDAGIPEFPECKGLDLDEWLAANPSVLSMLRPQAIWQTMSVEDFLPETEVSSGHLDLRWFAVTGAYFSPLEKKVVAHFLRWLLVRWPGDWGTSLALRLFWDAEAEVSDATTGLRRR